MLCCAASRSSIFPCIALYSPDSPVSPCIECPAARSTVLPQHPIYSARTSRGVRTPACTGTCPTIGRPAHPPQFCSISFYRRANRTRGEKKKAVAFSASLAGHRLCAAATFAPALSKLRSHKIPGPGSFGRVFAVASLLSSSSSFFLLQSPKKKKETSLSKSSPWRRPRPQRRLCSTRPLVVSFSPRGPSGASAWSLPASGITRHAFAACSSDRR